jgi:hypothetical protein
LAADLMVKVLASAELERLQSSKADSENALDAVRHSAKALQDQLELLQVRQRDGDALQDQLRNRIRE